MNRKASARIPASGLPIALETLMNTLLDSFELKSWNIYNDFNGACCLKIRWRPPQNNSVSAEGELQQVQPVRYRKKPPSAQNRDYKRSSVYHNSTSQMRTRSQTASIVSVESKEGCRSMDNILEENFGESPVTIKSDIPELEDTSIICSPPDLHVDSNIINSELKSLNHSHVTVEPPALSNIDCSLLDPIPSTLSVDSELVNIQNSEDKEDQSVDDEDDAKRGPLCEKCNCYFHDSEIHEHAIAKYQLQNVNNFRIFKCTRCPVIACIRCFQGGGAHSVHSDDMIDITGCD